MKYLDLHRCVTAVFPFIFASLTDDEPTSDYPNEPVGIAELGKILEFVHNDTYYPKFEDKCSYLISSIAGSQHFNNGNKRLGVVVLVEFLVMNEVKILNLNEEEFTRYLAITFPDYHWEKKQGITDPHALFLYNLAIIIGDPQKRGTASFDDLKWKVSILMKHLYQLPLSAPGPLPA